MRRESPDNRRNEVRHVYAENPFERIGVVYNGRYGVDAVHCVAAPGQLDEVGLEHRQLVRTQQVLDDQIAVLGVETGLVR